MTYILVVVSTDSLASDYSKLKKEVGELKAFKRRMEYKFLKEEAIQAINKETA